MRAERKRFGGGDEHILRNSASLVNPSREPGVGEQEN